MAEAGYVRHRWNSGQAAVALGGFRQLLYSDDAWTKYTVQQKEQLSREEEWKQLRLDIGQDAAVAYLTVLRTKTLTAVFEGNLMASNLDLAGPCWSVGYTSEDEVFR